MAPWGDVPVPFGLPPGATPSIGAVGGVEGMGSPVGGVPDMAPVAASGAMPLAGAPALSAGMVADASAAGTAAGAVVSVFWQALTARAPTTAAASVICFMNVPGVEVQGGNSQPAPGFKAQLLKDKFGVEDRRVRTERGLWIALAALALSACEPAKTTRQPEPRPEPPPPADAPRFPPGGSAPGSTPKTDTTLKVVFQWRLTSARTGQPVRESAVGYVRTDGTSGGVILISGEGAVIQPIPGTLGPDAAAVARRWLEARGYALANP